MGFRPRLRERGPGFRSKRVGFWLRFREREREKTGFSTMNLERQSWDFGHGFRERKSSPSMETTFTLRERLRFSPRERELGD